MQSKSREYSHPECSPSCHSIWEERHTFQEWGQVFSNRRRKEPGVIFMLFMRKSSLAEWKKFRILSPLPILQKLAQLGSAVYTGRYFFSVLEFWIQRPTICWEHLPAWWLCCWGISHCPHSFCALVLHRDLIAQG